MSAAPPSYEVAICGAGPVGMALAVLLARRGMAGRDIALLDARPLAASLADPRSIALSYGSRMLLEEAGAWPVPSTPIHEIHVSRKGHFGRSLMGKDEHGIDALGYVARYGDVVSVLDAACTRAGIAAIRPARVTRCDEHADHVDLLLDTNTSIRAQLAVQAEGGVFGEQASRVTRRDYEQTAVIARVSASNPMLQRAFERFTSEGPLALLPQSGPDGHHYALVWCVRPARAEALLKLDDSTFLGELGQAFGQRVGAFTATSARAAFPLGLNADPRVTARTVAIGNAAQTLHPVAGQGLNLGLRDAAVLARLIAKDPSPAQLAGFVAARKADRSTVMQATDTMARVFTGQGPAQPLLGLALGLLDAISPARLLLAELMMFGRR
jgi:2-octaprenyl-6-methoxyphenol hydroxylase